METHLNHSKDEPHPCHSRGANESLSFSEPVFPRMLQRRAAICLKQHCEDLMNECRHSSPQSSHGGAGGGTRRIPPYGRFPHGSQDYRMCAPRVSFTSSSFCIFSSSFSSQARPLLSNSALLIHPLPLPGHMMLFLPLYIIHFLAGNAVLIRINIWVLFTGSQSARIAWGIRLHKLS